jgi:hypothetical protein
LVAADRRQARVIIRYVIGLLESVPMLKQCIQAKGAEFVDLDNRCTVEIHTASFRTTRGYTVCAALLDEVAFWRNDETSANPDHEIVAALRPSLATIPNAMMLIASSPYARRGVLWEAHKKHFAKDGNSVLVWQADTKTMNPSISDEFIQSEYEKDSSSAAAEYGAQFRKDIEAFLSLEAIQDCVVPGQRELPYVNGTRYFAATDPSGGSSDSFTLAIAHRDKHGKTIPDCVRERRPPFAPSSVVEEFCETLKSYGITKVHGDRYAGQWPREQFRKLGGITYIPAELPKSDLYINLLPRINSGQVVLLDHPKLISQLSNLERRTARSGRDAVAEPPGMHDDVANSCALAVWAVGSKLGMPRLSPGAIAWAQRPYQRSQQRFGQPRAVTWNRNSQN